MWSPAPDIATADTTGRDKPVPYGTRSKRLSIFGRFGYARVTRPGILAGVRVVDLSMGWAGPLAARHLADMGADVIKVEGCVRFDWWRGWEATQEWIDGHGAEKNPAFNMVNRNKRDLTLDLSTPVGSDLLKRLVAISDVVVENYSAGVLPKLGLDYPVLSAINPALVMISMPAFGTDGPWSGYRAYGSTVEQASGLPHLSGESDHPPTMVHVALGDSVGGLNGAAALLTALYAKQRTGEGQHLDLSQSECLFPLGVQGILTQSVTRRAAAAAWATALSRHAPHGVYPCVGEDEWIAIAVQSEDEWDAFSAFSGIDGFGDVADRLSRVDELDAAVASFHRRPGRRSADAGTPSCRRTCGIRGERLGTRDGSTSGGAWLLEADGTGPRRRAAASRRAVPDRRGTLRHRPPGTDFGPAQPGVAE